MLSLDSSNLYLRIALQAGNVDVGGCDISTKKVAFSHAIDNREVIELGPLHGRPDLPGHDRHRHDVLRRSPLGGKLEEFKPGIKVLFITGHTDATVEKHGVRETEFSFLEKPFTLAPLAQKIRELVDVRSRINRPFAESSPKA